MKTIKVLVILSLIVTVCLSKVYSEPLINGEKELNPIDSSFGLISKFIIRLSNL